MSEELRSSFASTAGGVMTEEAGTITGDLELLTRPVADGTLEALVRYAGAEEWYRVAGSPLRTEEDHHRAHEAALRSLTTPGPVEDGNELPADLSDA